MNGKHSRNQSQALDDYRRKRDFKQTGEPAGNESPHREEPLFVIHKHAASNLHFDLRLAQDGILRSWALPKGPSLTPGEKRLAVAVEDHPLDYANFEGTIAKKQYGGGTVMLWDRGSWHARRQTKDKIDFVLSGEKLVGAWTLTRMGGKAGDEGKNWLLIKRSDEHDNSAAMRGDADRSVVSGRTMAQIANS